MKKLFFIILVIILIGTAGVIYFLWQNQTAPTPTIETTINSLDPTDPLSFLSIQEVVDLGEAAVEPLIDLSGSEDELTQWTVVVGLSSLRRELDDQTKITEVMKGYYSSPYSSIRLRAAASNFEFGDESGLSILEASLESNEAMLYFLPPSTEADFAVSVLGWAGYEVSVE